jgi:hypothetical protein
MPRVKYTLEAAQFIVGKIVEHIVLTYALKTVEKISHLCPLTFNLPEIHFELGKAMPHEKHILEAAQLSGINIAKHFVLVGTFKTVEKTSHIRPPSQGKRTFPRFAYSSAKKGMFIVTSDSGAIFAWLEMRLETKKTLTGKNR